MSHGLVVGLVARGLGLVHTQQAAGAHGVEYFLGEVHWLHQELCTVQGSFLYVNTMIKHSTHVDPAPPDPLPLRCCVVYVQGTAA